MNLFLRNTTTDDMGLTEELNVSNYWALEGVLGWISDTNRSDSSSPACIEADLSRVLCGHGNAKKSVERCVLLHVLCVLERVIIIVPEEKTRIHA